MAVWFLGKLVILVYALLRRFCAKDLARFTVSAMARSETALSKLVRSLGIEKVVSFCGWLSHAEALKRLRSADVVVLPAIREGGGGVVFEALACGAVPVVLDYGGPGDIVHPEVGYKVPPTMRATWSQKWKRF